MRLFLQSARAGVSVAHKLLKSILDLLREIGDQNAYARHLAVHRRTHSGPEWRRFCDERFSAKYRKAKCC